MLPDGTDPAEVLVVMEPTRNAWAPLAAWFRRRGARVVLVPPERSADLPDRGILRLPRHRREPGCDRLRRHDRRRQRPGSDHRSHALAPFSTAAATIIWSIDSANIALWNSSTPADC